jgi:hypothetical protein
MSMFRRACLAPSLASLVVSGCGRTEGDKPPEPTPIEGVYWWSGGEVFYGDGRLGPHTRNRGSNAFATEVTIAKMSARYMLTFPACQSGVPLTGIEGDARTFDATGVTCDIDEIARALGYASWSIPGLRVDLTRRSMAQRFCVTYTDGSQGCGQSNSSFQPLGEGGAGGAAAIANEGGITREAVNFADSHLAWRLENESSVMWECTEVDPARAQFRVSSVGGVRGSLSEDRSRRAPRPVAHSWGSGGATTLRHISSRSRLVREFA